MIRRGQYKYILAAGDPPQLFDLDNDPDELDNLAGAPAQAHVQREFETEISRDWDLDTLEAVIRLSQRRRGLVAEALARGKHHPWDYEPRPDHSRLYVRGRTGSEAVDRKILLPARGYPFRK